MSCVFESSDSGFTRYGGKAREKLFERLSSFQIVEEGLDWHSRSTKHRSSAKNIPVFDDDSHETIVSWRMEHPNGKLGCTQKALFGIKARPPALLRMRHPPTRLPAAGRHGRRLGPPPEETLPHPTFFP